MNVSAPHAFVLPDGRAATMYVLRNDGYCWGRVIVQGSPEQYDVTTRRDYYDGGDDEAAEAFIRKARRRGALEPRAGAPL